MKWQVFTESSLNLGKCWLKKQLLGVNLLMAVLIISSMFSGKQHWEHSSKDTWNLVRWPANLYEKDSVIDVPLRTL